MQSKHLWSFPFYQLQNRPRLLFLIDDFAIELRRYAKNYRCHADVCHHVLSSLVAGIFLFSRICSNIQLLLRFVTPVSSQTRSTHKPPPTALITTNISQSTSSSIALGIYHSRRSCRSVIMLYMLSCLCPFLTLSFPFLDFLFRLTLSLPDFYKILQSFIRPTSNK